MGLSHLVNYCWKARIQCYQPIICRLGHRWITTGLISYWHLKVYSQWFRRSCIVHRILRWFPQMEYHNIFRWYSYVLITSRSLLQNQNKRWYHCRNQTSFRNWMDSSSNIGLESFKNGDWQRRFGISLLSQ